MKDLKPIISQFDITGTVNEVKPLGNGLINDTYKVTTVEDDAPDYVLQRINDSIFTDVDLLQHNIEEVTTHIRQQLEKQGADDINRKVLTFVKASNGKTYVKDEDKQFSAHFRLHSSCHHPGGSKPRKFLLRRKDLRRV